MDAFGHQRRFPCLPRSTFPLARPFKSVASSPSVSTQHDVAAKCFYSTCNVGILSAILGGIRRLERPCTKSFMRTLPARVITVQRSGERGVVGLVAAAQGKKKRGVQGRVEGKEGSLSTPSQMKLSPDQRGSSFTVFLPSQSRL